MKPRLMLLPLLCRLMNGDNGYGNMFDPFPPFNGKLEKAETSFHEQQEIQTKAEAKRLMRKAKRLYWVSRGGNRQ